MAQPGFEPKLVPNGLSVRKPEWQVTQPACACCDLPNASPSLEWAATRSTWESAWQRRQFSLVSVSDGPVVFSPVWTVRMATPPTAVCGGKGDGRGGAAATWQLA